MRNETPEFEFQHRGEILWCHVRSRLQQILQFDEEWIIDDRPCAVSGGGRESVTPG